jgi:hypothetical protein
VQLLVGCGLNYSFPKEGQEGHHLAKAAVEEPERQLRPAPVAPAIDTLHCYKHLPSSSKWTEMPLVLRQLIAREVVADKLRRANAVGAGWGLRGHGQLMRWGTQGKLRGNSGATCGGTKVRGRDGGEVKGLESTC